MIPWPHHSDDGGKTWNLCKLRSASDAPPFALNNDAKDAVWSAHADCLPEGWGPTITPWIACAVVAADRADRTGRTFYYYCDAGAAAGTWGLFYVSHDGGATWSLEDRGKFPAWTPAPWIVSNPAAEGDVWMCFPTHGDQVAGNRLFHSTDGGRTFAVVPTVAACEAMTFGRGTSRIPWIYIFGKVNGATRNAFYKSTDLGATWIRISAFGMTGVVQIEGDMRTRNLVYVARSGRGIMYGEGTAGSNVE